MTPQPDEPPPATSRARARRDARQAHEPGSPQRSGSRPTNRARATDRPARLPTYEPQVPQFEVPGRSTRPVVLPAGFADTDKRIRPEDVEYLALEGGGGKGYAFLGALQILEQQGILDRCTGFGGSSAGAITALMLALRYTTAEIAKFLERPGSIPTVTIQTFDAFFGTLAADRVVPQPGARYRHVDTHAGERAAAAALLNGWRLDRAAFAQSPPGQLWTAVEMLLSASATVRMMREKVRAFTDVPPVSLLGGGAWATYLAYAYRDLGFFHAQAARDTFNALIGHKVRNRSLISRQDEYLTFEQLYEATGILFVVTGSNLATGRTELFSAGHTPRFPVADAVTISMSLPMLFKPYVIEQRQDGWPPCGVYCDGGVWNNLPFREFDRIPAADGAPRRRTLALRLSLDEPLAICTILDVAYSAMFKFGLAMGAGESQATQSYAGQTLSLDTEDLSLLQFSPDARTVELVNKRSRRDARAFLGLPVDAADADPIDEAAVAARRVAADSLQRCTP